MKMSAQQGVRWRAIYFWFIIVAVGSFCEMFQFTAALRTQLRAPSRPAGKREASGCLGKQTAIFVVAAGIAGLQELAVQQRLNVGLREDEPPQLRLTDSCPTGGGLGPYGATQSEGRLHDLQYASKVDTENDMMPTKAAKLVADKALQDFGARVLSSADNATSDIAEVAGNLSTQGWALLSRDIIELPDNLEGDNFIPAGYPKNNPPARKYAKGWLTSHAQNIAASITDALAARQPANNRRGSEEGESFHSGSAPPLLIALPPARLSHVLWEDGEDVSITPFDKSFRVPFFHRDNNYAANAQWFNAAGISSPGQRRGRTGAAGGALGQVVSWWVPRSNEEGNVARQLVIANAQTYKGVNNFTARDASGAPVPCNIETSLQHGPLARGAPHIIPTACLADKLHREEGADLAVTPPDGNFVLMFWGHTNQEKMAERYRDASLLSSDSVVVPEIFPPGPGIPHASLWNEQQRCRAGPSYNARSAVGLLRDLDAERMLQEWRKANERLNEHNTQMQSEGKMEHIYPQAIGALPWYLLREKFSSITLGPEDRENLQKVRAALEEIYKGDLDEKSKREVREIVGGALDCKSKRTRKQEWKNRKHFKKHPRRVKRKST
ncbi:unnamed protein product [Amoebophrya sp. A120]|nr:unnamed protein product [Amoebophrya sp. A120]|eukprot:GSA120T00004057001.1